MGSSRVVIFGIIIFSVIGVVWQCSSTNPNSPALDEAGRHAADWIVEHRASYVADHGRCTGCHGEDLRGGISRVSCFSAEFGGQSCHAGGPVGHPAGWRDPGLHGAAAKSQPGNESGFSSCRLCHGANFGGGVSGVSCFTAARATGACHVRDGVAVAAPHAPVPWKTYPQPTHTDTVDDTAGLNASACGLCHTRGANLRTPIITTYSDGPTGCFNSTLCHGQMGHPSDWAQPANHGAAARSNLVYCQQCHADKPQGGPGSNPRFTVLIGRLTDTALGNSGCEVCHAPLSAHPPVLRVPAAFGPVNLLNPLNTPWYLHCEASPSGFDACNRCHGAALDGVGGAAGATGCTLCHLSGLPTTLLNCTSCHSSPPNGTAYPNTAFAHTGHASLNSADLCGECHYGLGSVTLDHFLRAKNRTTRVQAGAVAFGGFSRTGGVNPAFNETTLQCANIYCHGATLAGGSNKSPVWSESNYLTAAGCGTCHGFPPSNAVHSGVTPGTACKTCHPHVNAGNTGFDDPTKHVNGAIDVTGGVPHAFPNPGAVHASTAGTAPFSGCVLNVCHANGALVGVYPVAAGSPPDCRACHTKAGPGNSCGSCHGAASASALTAGRPNGGPFPDVAGRHASPHSGFACALCHGANGTGSAAHGPSNRIAHVDADVDLLFTGEASGMIYTRSGLNNGHGTCAGTCHGETHDGANW